MLFVNRHWENTLFSNTKLFEKFFFQRNARKDSFAAVNASCEII